MYFTIHNNYDSIYD